MSTPEYLEITRDFTNELERRLNDPLNFIEVLIGPRQVGKTTGTRQIYDRWPHSKIFETADTVSVPDVNWIDLHWRRARELPPPVLLVFDEIQKVPGWSERIKVLFDEDRKKRTLRVVLLGSASLSVQHGLSESLAGRYEILRAFHWSYLECKKAFKWSLDQYLQFGGYPAAAELIGDERRWQEFVRSSIIEPVLSRDLMGLATIAKPALFRQAFDLCMRYPAQELSLNKILGALQDRGNVTTIRHYLDLFEGAFLMKTLQKFSGSQRSARSSAPKLLPLSPALVHAFTPPSRILSDRDWQGRMFELCVGAALAQLEGNLFYWRHGNLEVDFVLEERGRLYAIEVKSDATRAHMRGLTEFIGKYRKAVPVCIGKHDFERLCKVGSMEEYIQL